MRYRRELKLLRRDSLKTFKEGEEMSNSETTQAIKCLAMVMKKAIVRRTYQEV